MNVFANKTVLVVDDSANMRAIVSHILRALPVRRCLECADAVEALERLRHDEVDAVIVDFRMEPINGCEFVQLLRTAKDSPAPQVPILMISGHTERSRVLAALQAGVSGFLAKPISARTLAERLAAAFEAPIPRAPKAATPTVEDVNEDESLYLL